MALSRKWELVVRLKHDMLLVGMTLVGFLLGMVPQISSIRASFLVIRNKVFTHEQENELYVGGYNTFQKWNGIQWIDVVSPQPNARVNVILNDGKNRFQP